MAGATLFTSNKEMPRCALLKCSTKYMSNNAT